MTEKPTVGSPCFGAFPSDRIPKSTKRVNVHSFIHSSNSYILYHHIRRNVDAAIYEACPESKDTKS